MSAALFSQSDHGISVVLLAWIVDLSYGEYPNRVHPVVWMGSVIKFFEGLWLGLSPRLERLAGCLLLLIVALGFAACCALSLELLRAWPWLWLFGAVYWLKSSFALRALGEAALQVRQLLESDQLQSARFELRSLCSRDARQLDAAQLSEASISSLAENLSDSVIAPLFYFVLGGIPAAVLYRAVNTLDAMVGYKNQYRYFGWASARCDDVLNWLPARLTALLLLAAAILLRSYQRGAWQIAWQDHHKTPSPNGGWPMATMAGLLRIQLQKPGVYTLGKAHRRSDAATILKAWQLTRYAAWLGWTLVLLILYLLPRASYARYF